MPMRTGTARHDEPFSKHDFWVTKNPSPSPSPSPGQPPTAASEIYYAEWNGLPTYLNGETIEDTDVVIWHMSSNHHHPRDEDYEFDAQNNQQGVAQVMWSGFDLHPRNLFDSAPLYSCPPVPSGTVA